jgi:predicted dehydrogenase
MGMIGGGPGAFIGGVHRMAACLDDEAEVAAGCFSRSPEKSKAMAGPLHISKSRCYTSCRELVEGEHRLPAGERVDFVTVCTPNISHFEICKALLEGGFNVVCDKPATISLAQARELRKIVKQSGKVFALTHNYTGYPMVKQARYMCSKGMLGKINKIVVEYPQGWMAGFITNPGNAIGMWRMDPEVAGGSCCIGDLGTHCENLARYITGLEIEELCADLSTFIGINKLEDDGNILVHYKGGARGVIYASQISAGEENPLKIRVYGTKLGLEWKQEEPNYLIVKDPAGTCTRYSRGNDNLCKAAKAAGRLPWGHPEGFIEAFANLYREVFRGVRAELAGRRIPKCDHPDVEDGVLGLAFIETALASARSKAKWTRMKK